MHRADLQAELFFISLLLCLDFKSLLLFLSKTPSHPVAVAVCPQGQPLLIGSFHPQIGCELEEFTEILTLYTKTEVSGIKRVCGPLILFLYFS